MTYNIELSKKASKEFGTYTRKQQEKVISLLEKLATNPLLGKKLLGKYSHLYSLRVNLKGRIIYEVKEQLLVIYVTG